MIGVTSPMFCSYMENILGRSRTNVPCRGRDTSAGGTIGARAVRWLSSVPSSSQWLPRSSTRRSTIPRATASSSPSRSRSTMARSEPSARAPRRRAGSSRTSSSRTGSVAPPSAATARMTLTSIGCQTSRTSLTSRDAGMEAFDPPARSGATAWILRSGRTGRIDVRARVRGTSRDPRTGPYGRRTSSVPCQPARYGAWRR